ncbi:MAG: hypothetical protein A4E53_00743 [Pelotomaculum sp. PtaB.Bin104]|nr:MAG: hypothetical protein A4E53_00743 [Pelotomaculum sp. PtaB.Bin104]
MMRRFLKLRITRTLNMQMRKQKLRKLVALLVVVLVLGCWVGAAGGATDQEIYDRIHFMNQQVEEMEASSVYSNVYVDSSWVDLSNVSSTGTVVQHTYRGGNPTPTINNFTIPSRSFDSALDKVVRYVLGNVANVYKQEPLNTETTMITYQRTTVPIYVYGPYKAQELDEIILGLPNCFNISYDTSHGRSDPITPIEMPVAEATLNAIFSIDNPTYTISSGSTGEPVTMTMDVAPYIKDNRTYTPVRFLAYALGVTEEGIQWNEATQTVTIIKDDTTLKLTIGSTTLTKNSQTITMDVAPELVNPGRTMLPARWVSEAMGASVTWDETTKQVTIEILQPQEQG